MKSPRNARSPSAIVLVSGNRIILPAALDCAASSAPLGSAAKIRIAGLMDLAANAIPDIKPPPAVSFVGKSRSRFWNLCDFYNILVHNLSEKKVNKPLMGTTSVSICGACSRISKDMVPWPLQEQSNMFKVQWCASHQFL